MTPQELKNSILQLAIQGKLVEQRAEEGTAAEKKAAPPPLPADEGNPPPQPRQRQPTTRCWSSKEGERMRILNTRMNLFRGGGK